MTREVEVLEPGPLATVQDLGRPGHAAIGVPASGAVDPVAHRLANRLVGNPESAATIEATLGGLALRVTHATTVALSGAPCPAEVDGHVLPMHAPTTLPAAATLRLGLPARGLRTYVALRGGIDVPPVLGSRASDVLSGLGPPPLAAGDRLPIGSEAGGPPLVDVAAVPDLPDEAVLRLQPGPRADWFEPDALRRLAAAPYRIEPDSDRVAARLSGPTLRRQREGELPSEGLVLGAVQITPEGLPVVFLADHPTTGGYPVLAVVRRADLRFLAQSRPGETVRFQLAER